MKKRVLYVLEFLGDGIAVLSSFVLFSVRFATFVLLTLMALYWLICLQYSISCASDVFLSDGRREHENL